MVVLRLDGTLNLCFVADRVDIISTRGQTTLREISWDFPLWYCNDSNVWPDWLIPNKDMRASHHYLLGTGLSPFIGRNLIGQFCHLSRSFSLMLWQCRISRYKPVKCTAGKGFHYRSSTENESRGSSSGGRRGWCRLQVRSTPGMCPVLTCLL